MKTKLKHKTVSPYMSYFLLFFIFFSLAASIMLVYTNYEKELRNNAAKNAQTSRPAK